VNAFAGGPWPGDPVVLVQLARVEALLDRAALGDDGRPAARHRQLRSPRSKRLRPVLLLLAARLGPGTDDDTLVHAAAGIELLHEATLYHDDIVDEAPLRRGEASVQHAFGPATAAFAGSELLYATAEHFVRLPVRLRRAIGRAGDALCRGQLREVEAIGDLDLDAAARVRIMRDKTARLFAVAARVGATVGGAERTTVRRLARFGLFYGLGFQLADDLRDLLAPPGALGRLPGSDLYDGVYGLPVLYALERRGALATELAARLAALRTERDAALHAECLTLLRQSRGLARAQATLAGWTSAAAGELAALPVASARHAIADLHALLAQLRQDGTEAEPAAEATHA
jgi:heptaprenyl diphosphate synthase